MEVGSLLVGELFGLLGVVRLDGEGGVSDGCAGNVDSVLHGLVF
jgi:hypothetical protein